MPDQVEWCPEVQSKCYENHYTHQTFENRRKSVGEQNYNYDLTNDTLKDYKIVFSYLNFTGFNIRKVFTVETTGYKRKRDGEL